MDGLRWILLLVGLLILGGIYYFGSRKERRGVAGRGAANGRDAGPDQAGLDSAMERELERLSALINEERKGSEAHAAAERPSALTLDPEKIICLYLRCHGSALLSGREIAEAAEKVGLSFGDRDIFHRLQDREEGAVAIFSLANITNPGGFAPHTLNDVQTHGLCLFLTLPNYLSALDAWDAMLAAGRRLADLLEVDLLDETQSSLSRQRVAHIREQMREYDRRGEVRVPGGK